MMLKGHTYFRSAFIILKYIYVLWVFHTYRYYIIYVELTRSWSHRTRRCFDISLLVVFLVKISTHILYSLFNIVILIARSITVVAGQSIVTTVSLVESASYQLGH